MPRILDLERALGAHWDRQTLAVYADGLQESGDLRGELIALDLHIEANGATPELEGMRRDRLDAWLGGNSLRGRPWNPDLFQFGLLDDLYVASDAHASSTEYLEAFLSCPAAGYLRGIQIATAAGGVADALALLATRQHPWLEYLSIVQSPISRGPVPNEIVRGLLAATPQLHTLDLDGREIFEAGAIAASPIRRLELRGTDVLGGEAAMPNVVELDLALTRSPEEVPDFSWLRRLVDAKSWPGLRRLDVSRNEPVDLRDDNLFSALFRIGLSRFERVRLPSFRSEEHANAIRACALQAPDTELEIARSYYPCHRYLSGADAPPRLVLPACRLWPPPDTLTSSDFISIAILDDGDVFLSDRDVFERYASVAATSDKRWVQLHLAECVTLLEADFDAMSEESKDAWRLFWRLLKTIETRFPAAILARAVTALDDIDLATGGFGPWRALGERIRAQDLPEGADVVIKHPRMWSVP